MRRMSYRTRNRLQQAMVFLVVLGFLAFVWGASNKTRKVEQHDMPHAYCYTTRGDIACVPKH